MKLYNPFDFRRPTIPLMLSISVLIVLFFIFLIFLTVVIPGFSWVILLVVLGLSLGRVLYAIFKGE